MAITSRFTGERQRKPLFHRIILISLTVLIIMTLIIAFQVYRFLYAPNIRTGLTREVSVLIPTGSNYSDVKRILYTSDLILNRRSFEWVCRRKNYDNLVKPGHYVLKSSMSNTTLVNMLRMGIQTPVKILFNNIRTKEQLAGKISLQIEADSLSLIHCWNDSNYLNEMGFTPITVTTMFIPNTYEIWWTSNAYDFTDRMYKEYIRFWEGSRTEKATQLGLSITKVVILASIVEKETAQNSEKPLIAGVYLNRLKKGWPLQADPTLVFASGDYNLDRVLNVHKKIESPYNTYKYKGLPPGPICIPSIVTIDAVLNYKKHDYMYFCAKADMSGYHVFSRTLAEHNRNARAYQRAINQLGRK